LYCSIASAVVCGAVPDSLAQDIDDASLRDFGLKPVQDLLARGAVGRDVERVDGFGLGGLVKSNEVGKVDAVLAVVELGAAFEVTGVVDPVADIEGFEALLGGVRRHGIGSAASRAEITPMIVKRL
jgi:hypothetical protein